MGTGAQPNRSIGHGPSLESTPCTAGGAIHRVCAHDRQVLFAKQLLPLWRITSVDESLENSFPPSVASEPLVMLVPGLVPGWFEVRQRLRVTFT